MFTAPNKTTARSDKGFVVRLSKASHEGFWAEYSDGGRVAGTWALRDLNPGDAALEGVVRPDFFDSWGEPNKLPSAEQRSKLFQNLSDAFAFLGVRLVLQRAPAPEELGAGRADLVRQLMAGGFGPAPESASATGGYLSAPKLYRLYFQDRDGLWWREPFSARTDDDATSRAHQLLAEHPGCSAINGYQGNERRFQLSR